jgi:subtilisin family serine protease
MRPPTGPKPGRKPKCKAPLGPLLLSALAVALVGLSMAAEAAAPDRWRHPQGRAGAGQFRVLRLGPNAPSAFRPNGFRSDSVRPDGVGPNAAGLNAPGPGARADAVVGPEPRREGAIPAEGRPLESNRANLNPAERGPAELQRLQANPGGRGPAELQRQGAGALTPNTGARAPFQRGPAAGGFARRAMAERALQGPGRFGGGPFAGRFQPRPFAGLIARRPMIGERGFTGVPPVGETRFLTNEMVFHVPPNVSPQAVDNLARRLNLSTVASQSFNLSGGTLFHFRITDGRPVADVIRALESENIGVAQPNYVFRLQQQDTALAARTTGGDPSQYVIDKLRLIDVHRIAIGSNVLVAVIDSEIDGRHPELAGAVVDEFDAIGNHDKPHVHGTGMAGAIAAHRRLVGVAPGVRILAIHAFSSNGADSAQATSEHILMGIDWAIRKGAKIINMSFAGPDDPMLALALQKAHDKGIILIAAAGNLGPKSPPLYPGADPNVIAVTATDAKDQLLPQANQGAYIAVAAPGVDVLEPAPNGGFQLTTGTSVAAAHVSGIVALLLDRDPTLDSTGVRDILTTSAKHHALKGRDDQFGWGLVDPYRALQAVDAKVAARDGSKTPATTDAAATPPRPVSAR